MQVCTRACSVTVSMHFAFSFRDMLNSCGWPQPVVVICQMHDKHARRPLLPWDRWHATQLLACRHRTASSSPSEFVSVLLCFLRLVGLYISTFCVECKWTCVLDAKAYANGNAPRKLRERWSCAWRCVEYDLKRAQHFRTDYGLSPPECMDFCRASMLSLLTQPGHTLSAGRVGHVTPGISQIQKLVQQYMGHTHTHTHTLNYMKWFGKRSRRGSLARVRATHCVCLRRRCCRLRCCLVRSHAFVRVHVCVSEFACKVHCNSTPSEHTDTHIERVQTLARIACAFLHEIFVRTLTHKLSAHTHAHKCSAGEHRAKGIRNSTNDNNNNNLSTNIPNSKHTHSSNNNDNINAAATNSQATRTWNEHVGCCCCDCGLRTNVEAGCWVDVATNSNNDVHTMFCEGSRTRTQTHTFRVAVRVVFAQRW